MTTNLNTAKKFLSINVNRTPSKSVDGVLSAFNKAITDLEAVQQEHTAYSEKCRVEAEKLQQEAEASRTEVVKASRVLGKLKALISAE